MSLFQAVIVFACHVYLPMFQPMDNKYWVSGRNEKEARQKAAKIFNVPEDKVRLEQGQYLLALWGDLE